MEFGKRLKQVEIGIHLGITQLELLSVHISTPSYPRYPGIRLRAWADGRNSTPRQTSP
jgi:hypothetical protein